MIAAKLFWTDNFQAVWLPKEFRFEGKEVRISKHGNQMIIDPIADDWGRVNDRAFWNTMEQVILTLKNDMPQEWDWNVFEWNICWIAISSLFSESNIKAYCHKWKSIRSMICIVLYRVIWIGIWSIQ